VIGVPSRGRAGKSATLEALRGRDDVIVVCPPEEFGAYAAAYDFEMIMPDNPGIGIARQALLDHARDFNLGPFWMLDDDITGAFVRRDDKLVRFDLYEALHSMENWLIDNVMDGYHRVALAGPNFRHRAWSGPDVEWDKHLRNVVWVNPDAPINYWPHLKEDLDVVLQSLLAGWHTIRWNSFAFESPHMGSTEGGCKPDYDAGKLDEACRALVEKYPDVVSLKLDMDTGQLTNRVDWRKLRTMVPR